MRIGSMLITAIIMLGCSSTSSKLSPIAPTGLRSLDPSSIVGLGGRATLMHQSSNPSLIKPNPQPTDPGKYKVLFLIGAECTTSPVTITIYQKDTNGATHPVDILHPVWGAREDSWYPKGELVLGGSFYAKGICAGQAIDMDFSFGETQNTGPSIPQVPYTPPTTPQEPLVPSTPDVVIEPEVPQCFEYYHYRVDLDFPKLRKLWCDYQGGVHVDPYCIFSYPLERVKSMTFSHTSGPFCTIGSGD